VGLDEQGRARHGGRGQCRPAATTGRRGRGEWVGVRRSGQLEHRDPARYERAIAEDTTDLLTPVPVPVTTRIRP
jgi:hypothetical protein